MVEVIAADASVGVPQRRRGITGISKLVIGLGNDSWGDVLMLLAAIYGLI